MLCWQGYLFGLIFSGVSARQQRRQKTEEKDQIGGLARIIEVIIINPSESIELAGIVARIVTTILAEQ